MARAKFCVAAALAAAALWIAGCGGGTQTPTTGGGEEGHEHHHHGPHNGHVFVIGDEKYHGEWTHDESGKVTLYILDGKMEKEVPATGEEVVIEIKIGENAPTSYPLAAVSPMDGKASAFTVTDKNLEGALETLKGNVIATVKSLQIGDDKFENVKIEEHEHGHDHEKK